MLLKLQNWWLTKSVNWLENYNGTQANNACKFFWVAIYASPLTRAFRWLKKVEAPNTDLLGTFLFVFLPTFVVSSVITGLLYLDAKLALVVFGGCIFVFFLAVLVVYVIYRLLPDRWLPKARVNDTEQSTEDWLNGLPLYKKVPLYTLAVLLLIPFGFAAGLYRLFTWGKDRYCPMIQH